MLRCSKCTVEFLYPQPNEDILKSIYSAHYFLGEREGVAESVVTHQKRATAETYIRQLLAITGGKTGSLVEVGCGSGDFLLVAQEQGFTVRGIEISPHAVAMANARLGADVVQCGEIEGVNLPTAEFDVAAFSDVIEHVRDPHSLLQRIHRCLRPGGTMFLVTPDTDSWSGRLMRTHWMEYKLEHLFYFNRRSITFLLHKQGFDQVKISANAKVLSFDYIRAHFRRFRVPFWSTAVEAIGKVVPARLSRRIFRIVASGMVVNARKISRR